MNYFAFTYKYKDVTYKEKKETEIDILLLSQLAYLPMDNINFKNNKCDCRTNQPLPPVSRIAVNVRTISSI